MTPTWLADAIFYQIFPDRFAMSARIDTPRHLEQWDAPPTQNGFKGGDLFGAIERLDYLQALGVNAIYLNPIFQSAANHRYHTHDYFQVDPLLGGNAAFAELREACHARGMRVILDGVFNHASRGFFQFNHVLENGAASPYVDWFHFKDFPIDAYSKDAPNYEAWWNLAPLPKFNHANPRVREFLFRVAEHWMREGADGWRLDVPAEIDDDEFWREFRRRVKKINPEAYIVGEIWHRADRWLKGDMFDAVMHYPFTRACISFFTDADEPTRELTRGHSYGDIAPMDAPAFARALEETLAWYPPEINFAQMNLLDSHDTARFLTLARGDASALTLAWLLMFTFIGAPTIYYGDEIGMLGARDPDNRRGMEWDEKKWNVGLKDQVIKYCVLRKKYSALRRGEFKTLSAQGKVFAFARHLQNETIIVALNASRETAAMDIPVSRLLEDATRVKAEWSNEEHIVRAGHLWRVPLAAREGKVFVSVTAMQ
ncbi:MAG: glycoside hydrolase family 13 protein [Chloroflexi bacterium]|nr:glycoside hydrolase family 13 protein [Chloroflexota bacterium]